jgi:hypothetical protein
MVANVPYHSFKGLDLHGRVPFVAIFLVVLVFALVTVDPPKVLLLASLCYAASGPLVRACEAGKNPEPGNRPGKAVSGAFQSFFHKGLVRRIAHAYNARLR